MFTGANSDILHEWVGERRKKQALLPFEGVLRTSIISAHPHIHCRGKRP